MKLNFDLNNSVEKTEIVLGKKNYDKFGSVTNITDLTYDYNLMSAKSISFVVHKTLNNEDERLWNQIRDRRLVWVKEYDEWFQIDVNIDEESEIKKEVTGTSLCEAELGQIKVNFTEINTEDDIARADYKNPTLFYKPSEPKESLLHRVLKKAPNYSIDHVDLSLWNIQRTFSFDGSSIYDVLTGEIAKEIGCLFLFNSSKRTISVYDLQTNCLECGHRGDFTDICPECGGTNLDYGYGYDTSIFIDSENLAQNITLTGKQDEVKNYIKVCGGDDEINTAISACNPSGTQYIFAFSKEDKEDMSDELSSRLDEYLKEYDKLTPTYKDIMEQVYSKINEKLELESNMMPDIEQAETNAKLELSKLTRANLSPVAVQDVSVASIYTVNNAVIGMAKCVINSTVYKIEIINGSSSFKNQKWKGKFRLENYSNEEDFAENTGYIEIDINDDYAYFVEQKIQKTIDRDDIYLVDIFDVKTDLDVFTKELKKYCLKRLESFESAYESVLVVMREENIGNDSTYGNLYSELYIPYLRKLTAIQKEIKIRGLELETVEKELEELDKSRVEITSHLNFENYLGEELWKELCAFRREDTYENSNYVSDSLDDKEKLEKAQELLDKARNELVTTSTTQWTLSATLYNLLAMPEFSKLTGMFNGGNWIRIKIDDKIYRLRLVHYRISDNDIQNLEVEFSDVTQTANGLNDVSSLMSKVQSMATNFSAVVHQAEQGEKSFTELDKIRNDGLNAALYNISNSINQDFIIDEHGITGRMYDDILGTFAPEQVKINHNTIVWTDDYWQTAKCALGKIEYYNPILKANIKQYGLLADAVIAGILMGNNIIGGDIYSENYSSTAGTHIDLNNGDFSFAGGKLTYNTETDTLNLIGKLTFEDFDYSDPEVKEAFRESLGITEVEKDIEDFNNSSVLTPLEKQNMLDDWSIIQEEYKKNIALAEAFNVSDDSVIIAYTNAYNTLVEQIAKCELDNLTTTTSIDTKIYSDINNYHLANVDLANLINEKSKELSEKALSDAKEYADSKLNTFITDDYKLFVDNIQSQVDGKSQTYYQATDPSDDWNDEEKENHVGDLWYDSDETSKKTYVYTFIDNIYQWKEIEVPTEIFDLADGKAKIFTSKPSNYNVNDLWLVGNDYTPSISGVKVGYVLVSTKNNSDYTESDWILSINYTDDTVANTAISDNVLTPSEKRDLLNEINNIKSSYTEYSAICDTLDISYDTYTSVYNTLINSCVGELVDNIFKIDVSESTTLTDEQVENFKKCFSDYYTEESSIVKAIQDATNANVENAQDAADKAQEDATAALDLLTAIASDDTITPVEKLQLKEKYDEITSSYNKLLEKYTEELYGQVVDYKNLKSSYSTLIELFDVILEDMTTTYEFSSGSYTRNMYLTYIKDYYDAYQAFVNFINTELETNISKVSELANEAKNLGVELSKCLGFKTVIEKDYIISPFIGGGYLDIRADNKGSVVIDPLGISPNYAGYIFGVYNSSKKLVMGVDTSGNGVFEGKIISKKGELAGWNISEKSIYKDIGDYRAYIQSPTDSNSWVFSTQKKSETGDGYVGQTYITASGLLYSKNANIIGGKIGGWTIENNYLVAETDTGTKPGTLNRVFLQPFNKENYEDTWIISSQHEEIDSAGKLSGDSYPYWYITGGGDFHTEGYIYTDEYIYSLSYIYADKYIQTPMIYTDGASISGKTSIYNEGLELYHQTPYIDFHFGYNGGTAVDHTARIVEEVKGALTVYNSISSASDRRLKQDISDLDKKYLNALKLFKPVSYRFIKGSDNLYLGFIAQDIEKALIDSGIEDLPLVSQNNNGIYALDYNQITALNTLGHLDHEKRIKQLENDLAKANATIQKLLNK